MTKFTPRPWIYTLNPDGSATVTMPHNHLGKPCETCQANARLIAAAPDMFEKFEEIAHFAEYYSLSGGTVEELMGQLSKIFNVAIDALELAKATP